MSPDWVARSLRSVWHPCTQMQHHETVPLIPVSHGRGAWLFDHDGKRYLDAISSGGSTCSATPTRASTRN
jgi:adenosylmethionine-8-amino-7-oxononanoate aminotransferase